MLTALAQKLWLAGLWLAGRLPGGGSAVRELGPSSLRKSALKGQVAQGQQHP